MSTSNDIQRHLAIVATGEEPGGDLTFDGATGKLRVVRECPLDTAGTTRTTDQKQDLKTLLECSICLVTFDDPRTLPCLHSFCKKCLENFVDGKCEDELNCPLCRSKFALNKEGKYTSLLVEAFLIEGYIYQYIYDAFNKNKSAGFCSRL